MQRILKIALLILICLTGLLIISAWDHQDVLIESTESKTTSGDPVFNKIRWLQFKEIDVWLMNQSHHGLNAHETSWDRLAIVVEKNRSPKVARFFQFEPGPLEWQENMRERPFKVSCFMCHNNGPRVIRAHDDSILASTSLKDKLKIAYWNLRIKSYGRVIVSPVHDARDKVDWPPLRLRSAYENDVLKVRTCANCHKESGFLARGLLRRQQLPAIKFMLESGEMPPFGFSLSSQEKKEIQLFLTGF